MDCDSIERLDPADMTFALEELGKSELTPEARALFCRTLSHHRPVVREGALLGVARHIADPEIRAAVERVSQVDPIEGLRELASELLQP